MSLPVNASGLGDPHAQFRVFIGNRPEFAEYPNLSLVKPLSRGEIQYIGKACGNGWRKVFNVYAKLIFALNCEHFVALHGAQSWQLFREQTLLQGSSNTCLLFSPPQKFQIKKTNCGSVDIVMGKTYAKSLNLPVTLQWIDSEFAVDTENRLIVCPYFDYRQLSNIKIIRLVGLIRQFLRD